MNRNLAYPLVLALFSCSAVASEPAVILIEDFEGQYIDAMIKKMEELKKQDRELWIKIDSNGGSVFDGYKLAQAIENYGSPVTCVVDAHAFSMGSFFLQFCDVRLATSRSLLMIHKPSLQANGNSDELRQAASILDALTESMISVCLEKMTVSEKFFRNKINKGDWFFSASQALAYGAIDGIIKPKDIPHQNIKIEVERLFQLFP
jgi:ATP-dependent Clp protease protease subunit